MRGPLLWEQWRRLDYLKQADIRRYLGVDCQPCLQSRLDDNCVDVGVCLRLPVGHDAALTLVNIAEERHVVAALLLTDGREKLRCERLCCVFAKPKTEPYQTYNIVFRLARSSWWHQDSSCDQIT